MLPVDVDAPPLGAVAPLVVEPGAPGLLDDVDDALEISVPVIST